MYDFMSVSTNGYIFIISTKSKLKFKLKVKDDTIEDIVTHTKYGQ